MLENYKEFRSTQDAEMWGNKNFPQLTNEEFKRSKEFEALFYYGGNMFRPINRYLRGLQEGREELDTLISLINSIVLNNSTPENVIVYRSTEINTLKKICKCSILRRRLTFSDKAFLSTSLCPGCAYGFGEAHHKNCLLKLYLPKGTKGAYLSYRGTFSTLNEQEFLLAPNISFEIIKIHYFTKPRIIECKAIVDEENL